MSKKTSSAIKYSWRYDTFTENIIFLDFIFSWVEKRKLFKHANKNNKKKTMNIDYKINMKSNSVVKNMFLIKF